MTTFFCTNCNAPVFGKFVLMKNQDTYCKDCYEEYLQNKNQPRSTPARPVSLKPRKKYTHLERIPFLTPEIYWRERKLGGYFKNGLPEFKKWCNTYMIDLTSTSVYSIKRARKKEKQTALKKTGSESKQEAL